MDLERMKKVQRARSDYVEAANAELPEAQKGNVEQLKARFRTVAERMAHHVRHGSDHYADPEHFDFRRVSASRHIGTFEGPMPEVSVRFRYTYRTNEGTASSFSGGLGFNEYGENVQGLEVEWIHAPAGVTAEPVAEPNYVPVMMEYGEVFATEYLSFADISVLKNENLDDGMERLQGSHPSVRLALIEQSMDQYEAASPSPYELREGLVEA